MASTPLLLIENVFDTVSLFPTATLTTSSDIAGHEGFRVADYRRERTWWQPTTDGPTATGNYVLVDLGAGKSATPDYLWIDRGHNLAGKTVRVQGSPDNITYDAGISRVVPAVGTVGGDPTSVLSITEEAAAYTFFAAQTARRYWRFSIDYVASFIAIVPGIMVGKRTQLLGYSRVFDEDAGERTEFTDTSRAGYRGTDRTYAWRRAMLDLGEIGSTEYDATIRTLRRQLFELNQPAFLCLQYDTKPERGWLFQYDGGTWGFPKNRTLRAGQIPLREVGHSIL
jgi:hypothetical protein